MEIPGYFSRRRIKYRIGTNYVADRFLYGMKGQDNERTRLWGSGMYQEGFTSEGFLYLPPATNCITVLMMT